MKQFMPNIPREVRKYFDDTLPARIRQDLLSLCEKMEEGTRHFDTDCMGISVAAYLERNYLFTHLTAVSVYQLIQQGGNPTVLEAGGGTGLNLFAAHIAGARRLIYYDKDPTCVYWAEEQADKRNVDIDFHHEDLLEATVTQQIDVLINENLYKLLEPEWEPQLLIAEILLPNTHEGTHFVPLGVEYFHQTHSLGVIRFDEPHNGVVPLSTDAKNVPTQDRYSIYGRVIDQRGKKVTNIDLAGMSLVGYSAPRIDNGKAVFTWTYDAPGKI